MKKLFALLLCVSMLFALVACDKGSDDATEPEGSGDGVTEPGDEVTPLKVVNLINGTLGDLSFFDSTENGMKMLKAELGDAFEYTTQQLSYDETRWQPALLDASEGDADIIICGTWQMTSILEGIADDYPDKTYLVYDASVDWTKGEFKNVHCIEYKQNEGSYLAGVVAASMSKSGHIGFLGGMENTTINDFLVGYIQGAKDTNPDIKVSQAFVGNFNDAGTGADLASVQFAGGVDVGFACAGQAGLGMFEAAVNTDKDVLMVGVDSDQAMIFEGEDKLDRAEITMTSMLKRVDVSLYNAIKEYMNGTLVMGKTVSVGIAENCINLADNKYYQELVPAEVRAAVKDAEDKILAGDIKVITAFGMEQTELDAYRNAVK